MTIVNDTADIATQDIPEVGHLRPAQPDYADVEPRALPSHLDGLDADAPDFLEQAAARTAAIDCGVAGCDRSGHEPTDEPRYWEHRIRVSRHLGLGVETYADPDTGALLSAVDFRIEDPRAVRTVDDLRQLAVQLHLQATQIGEEADIIERRARRLTRPARIDDALRDLEG